MTSPNETKIKVTVDDETKAGLDNVNKRIKEIGETSREILTGVTSDLLQGAAQAAKTFVAGTVRAASDLGESVNAVNKIFGESATRIEDWGQTNSEAFGLSHRAFNEAIVPLGALLKNSGLAMDVVADSTLQLTQRAADMASVFNTDVPSALEAVQAGLRGESDPLERYGVSLNEAAVEAEALAESGKAVASQLTAQDKTLARVNLIMKQTADSAGDFADTTDGLANSTRKATAQIEDAKAKLGEGLLPVLAKGAQLAGDTAAGFGNLPAPIQKSTLVLVLFAAGFVYLAPKILAAKVAMREFGEGLTTSEGKMKSGAKAVGILGAALSALAIVSSVRGHQTAQGLEESRAALDKLVATGERTSVATKDLDRDLRVLAGQDLRSQFARGAAGAFEALGINLAKSGESLDETRAKVASLDGALAAMVQSGRAEDAAKSWQKLADIAAEQGVSVDQLKKIFPQYTDSLAGAGNAAKDAAGATKQLSGGLFDVVGVTAEAVGQFFDLNDAITASREAMFGMVDANIAVAQGWDDLNKELKDGKKSLNLTEQAGRDNATAIIDQIKLLDQQRQQAIATSDGTVEAVNKANAAYNESVDRLRAAAAAAGFNKDQVDALIKSLGSAPPVVNIVVNTPGLFGAVSDAARLAATLGRIDGQVYSAKVAVSYTASNKPIGLRSGGIKGAATGGPQDGLTEVGEEGRELVRLPTGSMVYPHANANQAQTMAGWGNGGGGPVQIIFGSDGSRLGDVMVDLLAATIKARGGDPGLLNIKIPRR